jgi:ribosomal protein S12 methylthiotransferase
MNRPQCFYLISLGCPKNLVDSAGLATLLNHAGFVPAATAEEADLLIVNTCGFIESAREESRTVLLELAQTRRPGQQIVAAGCYSQRFPNELADAVPGIDGLIGTRHWADIEILVKRLYEEQADRHRHKEQRPIYHSPSGPTVVQDVADIPRVAVQGTSAYLKLADGCRRSCAFCAIPLIKGSGVSRCPEAIVNDARWLAEQGVQEIVLIAQDTTDYGHDLRWPGGLPELMEQIVAAAPKVPWIRLMYAYPGRRDVMERIIETMARHPQILPYIDIPLQHAHPDVLRRMRRPADVEEVRHILAQLRAAMPNVAIRTTFLVGFPGETGAEFRALLNFVTEMAFDRVGVFVYSHEEGTPAAKLTDDVPPEVKEERRERLMAVQQPLSLEKNEAWVGRVMDVLVEGCGDGVSVGRSYRDAPEIDGLVLVQAELPVGQIIPVRITAALEYDLVGEPA